MSELAQQLIEENLKTKNPFLDLGKCGLDGTEDELYKLLRDADHLVELNFSTHYTDYDDFISSQNKGNTNSLIKIPIYIPHNLRVLRLNGRLRGQKNEIDISFLKELKTLERLSIVGNSIDNLDLLLHLKNLYYLDIGLSQINDYNTLSQLKKLKALLIYGCKIKDVTFMKYLHEIRFLNLYNNNIEDATCLKECIQLEWLRLSKNFINNYDFIKSLKCLKHLDLGQNNIKNIDFIEQLQYLSFLNLSENKIQNISSISLFPNLIELDISHNSISNVFPLLTLKKLNTLHVNNNEIEIIPIDFLRQLANLDILFINNNPINNIPSEFYEEGGDVLEEIKGYLESIAESSDRKELNEAKLIFVGVGDVGKTELSEAISEENYQFVEGRKTTIGINIKKWFPKGCQRNGEAVQFTANIWDFAGQEINYGTHQFFLTKNSVYVFVWETRKGEEKSDFAYWLEVVSLLSDKAPIFIVQNKVDIYEGELNQKNWQDRYPHIKGFYKTSCKTGQGLDQLRDDIQQELLAIRTTREIWNKDHLAVRKELEGIQADYISFKQYKKIAAKYALEEKHVDFLIKRLHDIGVVLYFKDDHALKHTVVTNTAWATDAAYCLIDNTKVPKGRFHFDALEQIWADERFDEKHEFLLKVMKKFELVFQLHGSEEYIVPELLPIETVQHVDQITPANSTTKLLRFQYHYSFMPKGILSRFICRMHEFIQDELFWRYGVVLTFSGSQAKVTLNDVAAIKIISIEVWGEHADKLLSIIRMHFDFIHDKLNNPPLKEKIPCTCPEGLCESENHPYLFEFQQLQKFQSKGKETRECGSCAEDISIAELVEGIKDTQNETFKRLSNLINKGEMAEFFKELKRNHVSDHQIEDLKNRFKGGNADYQFAEQLKVWLLDNLGKFN
ncbi:MAG: COR domain-containing protein [Flammeovirgaceae bacterium]